MRVGIISAFMDYHRKGGKNRGVLQPLIGAYIGGLLPADIEVEVINETWRDPDWEQDYDLLFISSLHPDFDRARQLSHYWRRRGARTVYGGNLASTYPDLCRPFFDSIVVGDPEGSVPEVFRDFVAGEMKPVYVSSSYDAAAVPTPRFDLLADQHSVPLSLEATRGCPFRCEFCALTGLGTRHHVRPVAQVVADVRAGQRMLDGRIPSYKKRMVSFVDNNIGGNLRYLEELCEALTPLKISWGSAITFNAVARPGMVEKMSRSGCRFVFMGLESFNPEVLADMNKHQNAVDQTVRVLDDCRRHGILVVAGLMLSPLLDDREYMQTIPHRLRECGLHVPTFVAFEAPIPGTPHFHRLAAEEQPAFLPGALLRDFTGYTLAVRPRKESVESFLDGYHEVLDATFRPAAKARKLASDGRRFLAGGYGMSMLVDIGQMVLQKTRWDPDRSYLAGTDRPPPEATGVPLTDADFDSESERRAILDPWKVTDDRGRALPAWRRSVKVFEPKGRLSEQVLQLVA